MRRRAFLGGGAALLALAACGTEAPRAARGGWSFTDDRGRKVELAERPTRVVAQVSAAATLWDFGVRPVAMFGPSTLKGGGKDPEAGDVDLAKVRSLGNVWDEFNVEKYVSLNPQVLVAGMYLRDELWYVPEKSKDAIEQVAPTIGIQQQGKAADELLKRYEELAVALGGRADAAAVSRFKTAENAVKSAAPGKKVLYCAASPEEFWVCDPGNFPDQKYLRGLGLDIVVPEKSENYYETLSWENVDKYAADAIFVDARAQSMKLSEIAKKPTWAKLPAVRAGRVYPWRAEMRFSPQGYAGMLAELSANLSKVV